MPFQTFQWIVLDQISLGHLENIFYEILSNSAPERYASNTIRDSDEMENEMLENPINHKTLYMQIKKYLLVPDCSVQLRHR
jgi:hypothetical protein